MPFLLFDTYSKIQIRWGAIWCFLIDFVTESKRQINVVILKAFYNLIYTPVYKFSGVPIWKSNSLIVVPVVKD